MRTSSRVLVAPGAEFWLGTDNLGRDLYSRVVHGARISLVVGLASTLLGAVVGGLIGPGLRLRRRQDRSDRPAGDGHHAGAADPGAGPGAGRRARARR